VNLTTQYGNEVEPVTAYYDEEGVFVEALCKRVSDGALRQYFVSQLRAPQGAHGVQEALEFAPSKERLSQ